jgi:hypothetical protein
MSLTVYAAFCILGMDFLIYVLFRRIYVDRRSALAREVAALRAQSSSVHRGLQQNNGPKTTQLSAASELLRTTVLHMGD